MPSIDNIPIQHVTLYAKASDAPVGTLLQIVSAQLERSSNKPPEPVWVGMRSVWHSQGKDAHGCVLLDGDSSGIFISFANDKDDSEVADSPALDIGKVAEIVILQGLKKNQWSLEHEDNLPISLLPDEVRQIGDDLCVSQGDVCQIGNDLCVAVHSRKMQPSAGFLVLKGALAGHIKEEKYGVYLGKVSIADSRLTGSEAPRPVRG
ncbi:hypothetical protein GCM10010909_35020 [Acidocella aquatica]|uniref:Uncharacterized protein n=1 Tax=Acidocella aquatica TaxID=1922313 RepID=A0ABQ6ABL2_9PROT|nr:hypothetical protein [Acidocella aquatica]GLR68820.1 hypothetical protein GCM10010909_35020 [Acidocella aquatica]